jgi:HAD superfamily hydrolase (TIGR01490 family)
LRQEAALSLAIFDLDNTLLAGDSDYLWGKFLSDKHIVDAHWYETENQRFYDAYKQGTLDIYEFLAFSLEPLTRFSLEELAQLHQEYMREVIHPLITDKAQALVDRHRQQNDTLLIITATNSFITRPIANAFGIDNLLATEPELVNGRYTGGVSGIPCYREGKVQRLHAWLANHHETLDNSWFYSDSHNDLPLLREVTNPVVVNPDPQLLEAAQQAGWPIIQLHNGAA